MDGTTPLRKKKFGDILVESGLISATQLDQALAFGRERGIKLGESLQKLGFVNEEAVAKTLARQLKIPYVDFDKIVLDQEVVSLLPETVARKHKAIVLGKRPDKILVAFSDPLNIFAMDEVVAHLPGRMVTCVAEESKISAAIDRFYKGAPSEKFQQEKETGEGDESEAVMAVNDIILDAVRSSASDIHLEPQTREVRIRFRVDGLLKKAREFPLEMLPSLVSRIKILSGLDIGERRKPQDGRFEIPVAGRSFDIRVSTLPVSNGEKVVMRLLDKSRVKVNLRDLGFEPEQQQKFEKSLQMPHEIILVTGPTGSGKTTTLYGALNFINSVEKNIVTVEDPLEYELRGVNQVQVNPKADLTFASALRSILRQDPDVVMIGEIRDIETAEIAVQAALTGHLVLSTLHTNDACGAVARLIDMDIPPFLIASSLNLVLGQRLVRMLCPHCKEEFIPPESVLEDLGLDQTKTYTFYEPAGCDKCDDSGFRGRIAIYEVLTISKEIEKLIMEKASSHAIGRRALTEGFVPLRQAGLKKVLAGSTSLDEILRVTLDTQE
jgi:type IV pilus assembly protein PilB